jgi:transcriptional regulator with XRE-family HTH domain
MMPLVATSRPARWTLMAKPTATEPDDIGRQIGTAIRTRRRALGLTMQELAQQSGLSQPFLSKVERGLAGLSLTSVDRIAEALGISAAGLFGTMADDQRYDLVRRAERPRIAMSDGWSTATAYTRRPGQASIVEFEGGPTDLPPFHYVHRNDQLCHVLAGAYEFEVDGALMVLRAGDTLSIAGMVANRYRVVRSPARLLLVLVSEDSEVVVSPQPGRLITRPIAPGG